MSCTLQRARILTELQAVLLGIIEGFTEFPPVSSTGHLVLASHIFSLEQTDFLKSFEIAIQLGSILTVALVFSRRLLQQTETWKRVIIGFEPAAVIGILMYALIKDVLLESPALVATNLIVIGTVLAVVDRWARHRKPAADITEHPLPTAFLIGLFQAAAVAPGVSRSGATIIGGLALGLSRRAAADFSFLLAIPTMLTATSYDLLQTGPAFTATKWKLLALGSIAAFLVSLATVRWLLTTDAFHDYPAAHSMNTRRFSLALTPQHSGSNLKAFVL